MINYVKDTTKSGVECVTIYFLEFDHEILISFGSKLILTLKLIKLRKLELGETFNILTEL